MRSVIVIYRVRTWAGKAVDWLWSKLSNRTKLRILDPEVIYCYSFHREQLNCANRAMKTMVYSVICTVTVSNTGERTETLTRLELTAVVGSHRYQMHMFDPNVDGWRSAYNIAGGMAHRITWNAFIPGHGFLSPDPAMKVIEPVNLPDYFELSYSNQAGNVVVAAIEISQGPTICHQFPTAN